MAPTERVLSDVACRRGAPRPAKTKTRTNITTTSRHHPPRPASCRSISVVAAATSTTTTVHPSTVCLCVCRGGGIANGKDNKAFVRPYGVHDAHDVGDADKDRTNSIAHTPRLESQANRQMYVGTLRRLSHKVISEWIAENPAPKRRGSSVISSQAKLRPIPLQRCLAWLCEPWSCPPASILGVQRSTHQPSANLIKPLPPIAASLRTRFAADFRSLSLR